MDWLDFRVWCRNEFGSSVEKDGEDFFCELPGEFESWSIQFTSLEHEHRGVLIHADPEHVSYDEVIRSIKNTGIDTLVKDLDGNILECTYSELN